MTNHTNMTIDAYLRQAGIKSNILESSKTFIPPKQVSVSPFNDLLQAARLSDSPGTAESHRGANISDYLSSCRDAFTMRTQLNRFTRHGNVFTGMAPSSHQRGCTGSSRQEQASHQKKIDGELIQGSADGINENDPAPTSTKAFSQPPKNTIFPKR